MEKEIYKGPLASVENVLKNYHAKELYAVSTLGSGFQEGVMLFDNYYDTRQKYNGVRALFENRGKDPDGVRLFSDVRKSELYPYVEEAYKFGVTHPERYQLSKFGINENSMEVKSIRRNVAVEAAVLEQISAQIASLERDMGVGISLKSFMEQSITVESRLHSVNDSRATIVRNEGILADGTLLSVQASTGHYCSPKSNHGPYDSYEVHCISGLEPSELIGTYGDKYNYNNRTWVCYPYVQKDVVEKYVKNHGGFVAQNNGKGIEVFPVCNIKPEKLNELITKRIIDSMYNIDFNFDNYLIIVEGFEDPDDFSLRNLSRDTKNMIYANFNSYDRDNWDTDVRLYQRDNPESFEKHFGKIDFTDEIRNDIHDYYEQDEDVEHDDFDL